jgi:hypothetical protein
LICIASHHLIDACRLAALAAADAVEAAAAPGNEAARFAAIQAAAAASVVERKELDAGSVEIRTSSAGSQLGDFVLSQDEDGGWHVARLAARLPDSMC